MIRYLQANIVAVISFGFFLIETIGENSFFSVSLWIGLGIFFAIPTSFMFARLIQRKLILKSSSFLDHRPIGGVWFFIIVGVVIGVIVGIFKTVGGEKYEKIMQMLFILCLSLLTATFVIIGIYVFVLERKYRKRVYIGMPNGLFFLENK
ncbi:MAG: hypothetical protein HY753_09695 [Nitrospirae bacterium]|nr:hypothetical protein [Nitrospirota bacterium]